MRPGLEAVSVEAKLDRLEPTDGGLHRDPADCGAARHRRVNRYGGLIDARSAAVHVEALFNQIVRFGRQAPIFWVLEDAHWITRRP
jgi:hypothetical protein